MEAVFLDRDGVINENRADHVKTWQEFQFLPGALEAIVRLSGAGFKVFVITNQAIINRGLVSRSTVDAINLRMVREVWNRGGRIDAVAYCPHRPEESCACRKPRPGLLHQIAREHHINLTRAVVIGDALTDLEAGQMVGCETILVLTGRGMDQLALARARGESGFLIAPDLSAATDVLLRQSTDHVQRRSISLLGGTL